MPKSIKVLSIKEPHASLLLTPYKKIETRSWHTNYRGEIYLHASSSNSMPPYNAETAPMYDRVHELYERYEKEHGEKLGQRFCTIYAKATLVDCIKMTEENIAALPQE